MRIKKPIRIDYYEIWCKKQKDKENYIETKFDITGIFERLNETSVTDRTFEYGGEKIRFQYLNYDEKNKVWDVQILRGRNSVPLGIVDDEEGSYTYFKLGEHKYYAESISILYSPDKKILALQINHSFITRTVLEHIFNKFSNENIYSIQLRPIIMKENRKKISKAEYCTKLAFVTKKPKKSNNQQNTLLTQLFGVMEQLKGAQLKLEIGFGRNLKKKDSLDIEQVRGLINVVDDIDGVEDILIDYKSQQDDLIDSVSLIKEKIEDWIVVLKEKNSPIEHKDIIEKMKMKFLDRIKTNMI